MSVKDTVSAADANRNFAAVLRRVREGRSVVVTNHGKPVARIVPATDADAPGAKAARTALFSRLRKQRVVNAGRWTREVRARPAAGFRDRRSR